MQITITPTSFKRGDALTLTVVDAPRKSTPAVPGVVDDIVITNPDTGAVGHGSVSWPSTPAVPAKPFGVVDSTGRQWFPKSDDGTTAVYTGTA